MVDGVFDNLTVNLLSKLKGKVGIGTQGEFRVGYDYLSNKLEVRGGNVSIFGRLFVEPGQEEPRGDATDIEYYGVSIERDDETGYIYLQGYRRYLPDDPGEYSLAPLTLQANPLALQVYGGGKVGIGTDKPTHKFHVVADDAVGLFESTGTQAYLGLSTKEGLNNRVEITNRPGGRLSLWTAGAGDIFNITRDGNVGIGTEKPQTKLDMIGNRIRLRASTNPGTKEIVLRTDGAAVDLDANNTNLFIKSTTGNTILQAWGGNVGIGTTSPKEKLEVNGNIKVTGDIFLTNADCAEEFDIAGADLVVPGTVMVIDRDGELRPSEQAYDKRVAGVISGAGDLRPGITLDKRNERANRLPLALTGKVYCKIDAQYGSVDVGDLLTTSPTYGHAMRATDPIKAFGAVIGKALKPLKEGCGLIPILIALQ